jgi:hypothetical protein
VKNASLNPAFQPPEGGRKLGGGLASRRVSRCLVRRLGTPRLAPQRTWPRLQLFHPVKETVPDSHGVSGPHIPRQAQAPAAERGPKPLQSFPLAVGRQRLITAGCPS